MQQANANYSQEIVDQLKAEYEEEISELKQTIEAGQKTKEELSQAYSELENKNQESQRYLSDLQEKIKHLEESEQNYQIEIMNLTSEKQNLIEDVNQSLLSVKELENKLSSAHDDDSIQAIRDQHENQISSLKSQIENLIGQLEMERIERKNSIDLYEQKIAETSFQYNNLLAQFDAERQVLVNLKSDFELRCKKLAAKLKVKEREIGNLEEKLKVAKENELRNVNEQDVERDNKIEELQKRIEELQFTASSLDSGLQTERQRRRELEDELQGLWKTKSKTARSPSSSSDPEFGDDYSLLMGQGTKSPSDNITTIKRFFTRQKYLILRGPRHVRIKRLAIIGYLIILHFICIKCAFS